MPRRQLSIAETTLPGAYIGELYTPAPISQDDLSRVVCLVGRGSDELVSENLSITRGQVIDERLTFTANSPHIAVLQWGPADGLDENSQLRNEKNEIIDRRYWDFQANSNGEFISIIVSRYQASSTYYLTYQSLDPLYMDPLPTKNSIRLLSVGDVLNEDRYSDQLDVEIDIVQEDAVESSDNTGTGQIRAHASTTYSGPTRNYTFIVEGKTQVTTGTLAAAAVGGNTGSGTFTLPSTSYVGADDVWTFTVTNTSLSGSDVQLDMTWQNGSEGPHAFTITAPSPSFTISVAGSSLTNTVPFNFEIGDADNIQVGDAYTVTGTNTLDYTLTVRWFADSVDGGDGTLIITDANKDDIELIDDVHVDFGTFVNTSNVSSAQDLNLFEEEDEYVMTVNNMDRLNWNFERNAYDTVLESEAYYDITGEVAGRRNVYYIVLKQIPTAVVSVTLETTNTTLTVYDTETGLGDYALVEGTPYVWFKDRPEDNLIVNYTYRNAPSFGQTYYVSKRDVRPLNMYDRVIYLYNEDDDARLLGPVGVNNHLRIQADHARELGVDVLAYVQARDLDRDGIVNVADYRRAILATEEDRNVTDIAVLGNFDSSDTAMDSVIRMNRPIERRERLLWVGAKVNTPIGNQDTADTLAYYARRVFQVFGGETAEGHGSFILLGNTWAKRTIQLEDGSAQQITLDGSFIAATAALITSGFSNPSEALLRKTVAGYDSMQTYSETDMKRLTSASITYLEDEGVVQRFVDTHTTDTSGDQYNLIEVRTQAQYITRRIRNALDTGLIGYRPVNPEDGNNQIRSVVGRELNSAIASGFIGQYTNSEDDPSPRALVPDQDIFVWRDKQQKTKYHTNYWFNARYTIYRIFGLYSIDQNAFA